MTHRSLLPLGLLLLGSIAALAAPAPKPWSPKPGSVPAGDTASAPAGSRGATEYVDGVPDTGQFLPDTATLGRVDDRVFSVYEFREYWFASYAEYRPKPDSAGRAEFLTSMANKEVLASLARKVNRPLNFEDRSTLREHTQRTISNVVFQRLVADSAHPTEAEMRHAHAQAGFQLRVQHIVTADRASAAQARADLASGRLAWPEAVKHYSIAASDSGPDGEIGWVSRSALNPGVALQLWDLPDGGISDVFVDRDGYQVVRIMQRRPVEIPPFDRLRGIIASELGPIKAMERMEQIRAQLRVRTGMTYDTANMDLAVDRFSRQRGVQRVEDGRNVLDLSGHVPDFTPADTGKVLARWKDGQFTLGGFLAAYRALSPVQRPNVSTLDAFRATLDSYVLEPYMAQLGIERGLDKDPMALGLIEKRREQILVEHLFADSVTSKVWITPAERQQYYKARIKDFWSWATIRFAAISRPTKEASDSLAERLRGGEKAEDILKADSLQLGHRTGSIRSMRENQQGPFYDLLWTELNTGGIRVVGPDEQGNYAVIQKLAHDPGHTLKYEEVTGLIDESLQNIKAEAQLKALIARHRPEHHIELHFDRVMSIKLTDPLMDVE